MLTIAKLFGKSPFAPLQAHMEKVAVCIGKLSECFDHLENISQAELEQASHIISKLEHEADLSKNDIRNHLPNSLFLPMDRSHFLEILSTQDKIADQAENLATFLTLIPLSKIGTLVQDLQKLFHKSKDVFNSARQIIQEIDELLESSFGGLEAEKVKSMVEHTATKEEEVTHLQKTLLRKLFTEGSHLNAASFQHWYTLINEIGLIAQYSERLANRIRMVLELK